MWSAIITSAATIAAVLYTQGPIIALALTAVSSMALLIVLRAAENKFNATQPQARPLEVIDGNDGSDLGFPPLHEAS